MVGRTNKVKKVATINPKIIVHASGPQNATLSPPRKNLASKCVNKLSKSIFKPIANGIKPSIAADAVNTRQAIFHSARRSLLMQKHQLLS